MKPIDANGKICPFISNQGIGLATCHASECMAWFKTGAEHGVCSLTPHGWAEILNHKEVRNELP